jgi:hypothetical protein
MMEILTNVREEDWETLLTNSPNSNIYHSPEWRCLLESTFNFKAKYFFSINDNGKVIAMLPLFYVKSKLSGNRLSSVPFSHICGPIGSPAAFNDLISEAINLSNNLKIDYLEIRDSVIFKNFVTRNLFSDYALDISQGFDQLRLGFDKSTKRCIRRSIDNKITVETSRNIEDLIEFYELNCLTKRKKGVPGHSWSFFLNMRNKFRDNFNLYLGKYKGEIIAGKITLRFKDTILIHTGASNPKMVNSCVNYAIILKILEEGIANGYKCCDLGRASYDNVGLIQHKMKWGAIEQKMYYSYSPKDPILLVGNRQGVKYRLSKEFIKKMPLPIYKTFSEKTFHHFG